MKQLPLIILTALTLICCGKVEKKQMEGNLYPSEYKTLGSTPYNIQVNKHALCQPTDSQSEYQAYKLEYPAYEASGSLIIVSVDSARLIPAMSRYLVMMEMRADTICEIDEKTNGSGVKRWVFVHPKGKEQIQWMATDSMSMYVAGNIHFEAAKDSTIDIAPALENIRTDIVHLVDNLSVSNR